MSESTSAPALPATMRALVLRARGEPMVVDEAYPVPAAVAGSAVVRILSTLVVNYARDVYSGARPYPFPTPLVPGSFAVGRVAALGPDATTLKPGQLVWVDVVVRSRDDEGEAILSGFFAGDSPRAAHLMHGEWRDSTWAQYARMPLETLYAVDEERLFGGGGGGGGGLGTGDDALSRARAASLAALGRYAVPFGGLDDIGVRAGETVIVAPATGPFGGAAVHVALAMGAARVVAVGRSREKLARLERMFNNSSTDDDGRPKKVTTVALADADADADADAAALAAALDNRPADAYLDISPPAAAGSSHLGTCVRALARGGRVSLMGGLMGDVALPHREIMRRGLTLRGTWMYTREQARRLLRLVETGALRLDGGSGGGGGGGGDGHEGGQEGPVEVVAVHPLAACRAALDDAAAHAAPGQVVALDPWM